MDFINEGKTGKVKLQDIFDNIYEDCDSALADYFYKGLKSKMDLEDNIDLADAEVQLYIRDFLELHENDYQYDLLKQALEPYYDHEYDLNDEDIQESYEVLEEDEYLDENATFEEIIYRMECAEIYEDLYNAAMLIVDPKLQNMVRKAIQQCEDDGDEVEEAYSIVTSDLLDMHINDKNEEFLNESEEPSTHFLLSRIFAQYPDISEEDEDYLNGLNYEELVSEIKNRGWEDLLEESANILEEDEKDIVSILKELEVASFEELREEIETLFEEGEIDDYYDDFIDLISEQEDKCADYIRRRSAVTNTDWKDELGIEEDYVKSTIEEMIKSIKVGESKEIEESKKVESEENSQEFEYGMLARLKSDCDYYLGYGNRNAEHALWAKNEQGQIDKMREIYNKLKEKPEWLSEEDINNYAKEMGVIDLPSTTDGTAEKEIQDMLDRSEKRSKELSESYEVWQKYYEDGEIAKPEYVQSFDTFEEAQKFVDGLNEDPNCEAWVKDLNESKKVTEAEDMKEVQYEIETALEDSDATDQEIEQVQGSINVLKTDEESAIDGYDTFIEDTKEVVDPELANAIEDQMEEIKADEEEHIEKLDTIKDVLDEAKGVAPDFKVDFEGDMTIDMGYTNEEGAEKRAKELLGDVAKSTNVRDLNVDVKDVKRIEKENKTLTESEEKFSGVEFEKNIPHVMRYKQYDVIEEEDGKTLYWITQQFFTLEELKKFQEAFIKLTTDTLNFKDAYVTVRDLSTYDLKEDHENGVLCYITKYDLDYEGYEEFCKEYKFDLNKGWLEENKELKKEDKTIWSSEYNGDETTADEAYQEYIDEFEPTPIQPKSFEDWLEDTFEDWLEAESNAYTEEHPEVKTMKDWEIDEIDFDLREKVQKEIEANMDDLKEQYEEYVNDIKESGIMTKPSNKETWQSGWYEQDAEAQWEVMDEDFSFNVWPMIQNQCKDDILIMLGSVGRWNGIFNGGKIIHADEKNIRNIMGDYDEVSVTADDEGHLSMGFDHHDGTDGMALYTIPEDLTELAKAMGYEDVDELDIDIRQDYVDIEELAKHADLLVPIINKERGNI